VRHAHVNIPDFSDVQRSSSGKASEDGDFTRRAFTYSIVAGGTVIGAHAAKNILQDFLMTMSASVSYLLFNVNVTRFQLFLLFYSYVHVSHPAFRVANRPMCLLWPRLRLT
jgi:hypothetical protein